MTHDKCTACNGTGKKHESCGHCSSIGWVEDLDDGGTMDCPHCFGESAIECSECEGTGDDLTTMEAQRPQIKFDEAVSGQIIESMLGEVIDSLVFDKTIQHAGELHIGPEQIARVRSAIVLALNQTQGCEANSI